LQLAFTPLLGLKKSGVLDGNHGLVGKCSDQIDLLLGKRLNLELVKDEDTNDIIAPLVIRILAKRRTSLAATM
jgi:hypothetical protein